MQFRSWCEICIKARGQERPHLRQRDKDAVMEIPGVSYDYGYLRERVHEAGEDSRPILVSVNAIHGWITANMAPSKYILCCTAFWSHHVLELLMGCRAGSARS